MLIAKHRLSHSILFQDQQVGRIHRSYFACISGHMAQTQGTIDEPIGRKPGSIIERQVHVDGKCAVTDYHVIKQEEKYSFVEVKLRTGRTHQIRVHFAYIGHPLLGDDLYGDDQTLMNRHALHCYDLSFVHPLTGEEMTFSQPLPADMRKFL
ncbi:RNA pseudouridine synthase YjbO [Gracilibacillus halophilus YIM-C55.5]|uniref:RNA pseudouridylate synthase n=2 Tax=Gracilibacillus TaxID=74385 RepID=N4WSQ0_9BACI|nr:RNA pseudouridine synthase YjbO [Gracilibacillus halophilus YIM-C55.5]